MNSTNDYGINELDELSDVLGELSASLDTSDSKLEEDTAKQMQEGFACLFPDWDLHPVKR